MQFLRDTRFENTAQAELGFILRPLRSIVLVELEYVTGSSYNAGTFLAHTIDKRPFRSPLEPERTGLQLGEKGNLIPCKSFNNEESPPSSLVSQNFIFRLKNPFDVR